MKKSFVLPIVVLCLSLLLSACEKATEIKPYKVPEDISVTASETVAQNERFSLKWDADASCVMLEDVQNGTVWSTVPYEFYLSGDDNSSLNSPIFIQYYNPSDGGLEASKAYSDCISDGLMSAEKTEKGLKLEFFFADAEITVPVYFELREDSLYSYVPAKEIKESGKTRLIELSLLPYMCSTPNTESRDTYVVLPSGCGALAFTDEELTAISRTYSGDVYGVDAGRKLLDNTYDREAVRIPAYGVKSGEKALLAFIEKGSAAARIDADIGNFRNGHSTAYTTFETRSYDEIEAVRNKYNDERIYAKEIDKAAVFGVSFYPLEAEKADYSGMAQKIKEKYYSSSNEKTEQKPLHIELLGGALTKHFIMGVPYNALTAATTYEQAQKIIDDLKKELGSSLSVTLSGFGGSGISTGAVAGGFDFSSALGGKKGQKNIEKFCKENSIELFTDFDIVRFNKNANGFKTSFDVAKTASHQKAFYYPLSLDTRIADDTQSKIFLLSRAKLGAAVEMLSKKTDFVSGISLSTLGSICYSDYVQTKYYSKGNTEEITEMLADLGKKHPVSVSGANSYAAAAASVITDVPLQNGSHSALDAAIPFYQLIFGSSAQLYSQPVNLATDSRSMLLRAVEMGVSPSFTLCNDYNADFKTLPENVFYPSVYENIKSDIVQTAQSYKEFYEAIKDSYIVSHKINGSVTESVFQNGVTVTVNHSDKAVLTDGKTLEAYSFAVSMGKGAAE